jgi:hypothetical protein
MEEKSEMNNRLPQDKYVRAQLRVDLEELRTTGAVDSVSRFSGVLMVRKKVQLPESSGNQFMAE